MSQERGATVAGAQGGCGTVSPRSGDTIFLSPRALHEWQMRRLVSMADVVSCSSFYQALAHAQAQISRLAVGESVFYVGATTRPPWDRWNFYPDRDYGGQRGVPHCERFRQMHVLVEGNGSEIASLEKALVQQYRGTDPRCANLAAGGGGFEHGKAHAFLYVCVGLGPRFIFSAMASSSTAAAGPAASSAATSSVASSH